MSAQRTTNNNQTVLSPSDGEKGENEGGFFILCHLLSSIDFQVVSNPSRVLILRFLKWNASSFKNEKKKKKKERNTSEEEREDPIRRWGSKW